MVFLLYQPTPHLPSPLIPSSFQLVFAPFRWKPLIKVFESGFLLWFRAQSAYMNVDTNLCSCESFEKVMASLAEKTLKFIIIITFFFGESVVFLETFGCVWGDAFISLCPTLLKH